MERKLEAGSIGTELSAKERGKGEWKQMSPEDTVVGLVPIPLVTGHRSLYHTSQYYVDRDSVRLGKQQRS